MLLQYRITYYFQIQLGTTNVWISIVSAAELKPPLFSWSRPKGATPASPVDTPNKISQLPVHVISDADPDLWIRMCII